MDETDIEFIENYTTGLYTEKHGYLLMAIARRRFNEGISNSEEVVHRRIITKGDDIERQVGDLRALMSQHDLHFRLYLTVNSRDLVSSLFDFQQDISSMIESLYNGDEDELQRVQRLGSEWKSAAHAPENSNESMFLFDLDDVSQAEMKEFKSRLRKHTSIHVTRETPNGYHIITAPFNYNDLSETATEAYDDLDRDGMVYVATVDNREDSDV